MKALPESASLQRSTTEIISPRRRRKSPPKKSPSPENDAETTDHSKDKVWSFIPRMGRRMNVQMGRTTSGINIYSKSYKSPGYQPISEDFNNEEEEDPYDPISTPSDKTIHTHLDSESES